MTVPVLLQDCQIEFLYFQVPLCCGYGICDDKHSNAHRVKKSHLLEMSNKASANKIKILAEVDFRKSFQPERDMDKLCMIFYVVSMLPDPGMSP